MDKSLTVFLRRGSRATFCKDRVLSSPHNNNQHHSRDAIQQELELCFGLFFKDLMNWSQVIYKRWRSSVQGRRTESFVKLSRVLRRISIFVFQFCFEFNSTSWIEMRVSSGFSWRQAFSSNDVFLFRILVSVLSLLHDQKAPFFVAPDFCWI